MIRLLMIKNIFIVVLIILVGAISIWSHSLYKERNELRAEKAEATKINSVSDEDFWDSFSPAPSVQGGTNEDPLDLYDDR